MLEILDRDEQASAKGLKEANLSTSDSQGQKDQVSDKADTAGEKEHDKLKTEAIEVVVAEVEVKAGVSEKDSADRDKVDTADVNMATDKARYKKEVTTEEADIDGDGNDVETSKETEKQDKADPDKQDVLAEAGEVGKPKIENESINNEKEEKVKEEQNENPESDSVGKKLVHVSSQKGKGSGSYLPSDKRNRKGAKEYKVKKGEKGCAKEKRKFIFDKNDVTTVER